MTFDIAAGNTPDIIDLGGLNAQNLIKKGVLLDLTPYLKKYDTLNTSFFGEGLLDASKYDNKVYYLMKYFTI